MSTIHISRYLAGVGPEVRNSQSTAFSSSKIQKPPASIAEY